MGSLHTLPRAVRPSSPPPPSTSMLDTVVGCRVYASFFMKVPSDTNSFSISNRIECYNPQDNTWTFVSSIPGLMENHFLKGLSMVSIGHLLYVIGGQLCRKDRRSESELSNTDVEILSRVLCYNIRTNQWFSCKPLNIARYDFACTVCDNKIYVAGGQSIARSARGISSTEVYDPNHDTWTHLPYMSTLRFKCVGVTWKDKVHVVGGFAVRGDSDSPTPFITEGSSAEVYNAQIREWEIMQKMWQLDVPPKQIVAMGAKLYSSGDCLNAWKGHIESYDEQLQMWNVVDGSQNPTLAYNPLQKSNTPEEIWSHEQRLDLTMAPIGKYLFFLVVYRMNGESTKTTSMVHRFDTSATKDGWSSYEPIEEEGEKELCSNCCVVKLL